MTTQFLDPVKVKKKLEKEGGIVKTQLLLISYDNECLALNSAVRFVEFSLQVNCYLVQRRPLLII